MYIPLLKEKQWKVLTKKLWIKFKEIKDYFFSTNRCQLAVKDFQKKEKNQEVKRTSKNQIDLLVKVVCNGEIFFRLNHDKGNIQ